MITFSKEADLHSIINQKITYITTLTKKIQIVLMHEITNLIDFVYPNLVENCDNAGYMVSKAILA
jgi:hypothetical protein